ncbi:group I truncated hemoglobin [Antarcticimicrobium luteum]|uniref:Group 1 truncated hemoglobin n=1 Tax=Antarcticimicrobium luteum TaxID=2547397 RepID=A0A4R5VFW8_9RHOB|nr:group 1 truncated hemoglobin [Antarcticimicrobium luteum]TDK51721.1 group 1 truncated hemoglobin [Antarcticimicrobium luteum]
MERSLYERLGSAAGIKALVADVVEAHMNNPVIQARFLPYRDDPDNLAAVSQQLCDFFCAGSGGPEAYTGRGMVEAHRGMNISAEEYLAATDDIMSTLTAHGIDEQTRNDVLAIAYALKGEIMRV